jgi:hypothetical protein
MYTGVGTKLNCGANQFKAGSRYKQSTVYERLFTATTKCAAVLPGY